MKKFISLILTAALLALPMISCTSDSGVPVIGISQYGEHPSLDNCREGAQR